MVFTSIPGSLDSFTGPEKYRFKLPEDAVGPAHKEHWAAHTTSQVRFQFLKQNKVGVVHLVESLREAIKGGQWSDLKNSEDHKIKRCLTQKPRK